VICNNEHTELICLSCFERLQDQVVDSAALIAVLSRTVLRLSEHLAKMEKDQTVEQQGIELGLN